MSNYTRIAIVTGATSGIGEATARKFVAGGFGVVGNGRTAGKLAEMEKELGAAFCGVAGNAFDHAVIDRMFVAARERFGADADIVVVNAGRGLGGSVTGANLEKFDEILKLNVSGALALMKKAANVMLADPARNFPKTPADIIVIGSVVGRNVSPFSAVYGATKFAIHSLTEGLRREVGPKGIRVSLVEPGIALSGFQDGAGYDDATVNNFKERFGPLIVGTDVAEAINFIVAQPPHVHVCDIVVRATRQDYP